MKNPNSTQTATPPKLIPTLIKGFNTIANHWYLIFFPILLDVLIWLGPKLKVKNLLADTVAFFTEYMQKVSPPEMIDTVNASQPFWNQLLDQLNLTATLRTIPVGIPSLIARELPITSPLGSTQMIVEMPNINWVFAALGLFLLVGVLLGSLYFLLISRVTAPASDRLTFKDILASYGQSLVMYCLLIIVLAIISIPMTMVLAVLASISFGMGQIFIMMALFAVLWLIMPLVFSPHGIFVLKQKALPSMLISVRLVRLFLPGTGMFIFLCLLISEGMNMLWTLPEANSWMTLIGIGGHGFVITGLLAASFIYYRDGLRWMQDNLQRMAAETAKQQIEQQQQNGGTPLE